MNPETDQNIAVDPGNPAINTDSNAGIAFSASAVPPEVRESVPVSPVPYRKDLAMARPGQYCAVHAWQRVAVSTALHDELGVTADIVDDAVYALIWAFTVDGDGCCYASASVIGSMVGASAWRVRNSITHMLRAGLIVELPPLWATRIKRLAAVTDHPAVASAKRWDAGEVDSPAQGSADDARSKLSTLRAQLDQVLEAYTDDQLAQLDIGAMVAAAVGLHEPQRPQAAPDGADEVQDPQRHPKQPQRRSQASHSAPDLIDLADAPEGYRELAGLAADHNANKIRWRDSVAAYKALVADGYSSDEISDGYRALAAELAGVPDGKWPNIYAYLTSTASCTGAKGARRRMDAARERAAREAAAAAAAEEERAARAAEEAREHAYTLALEECIAEDDEYRSLDAQLKELYLELRPNAQPGDAAYDARQRIAELEPLHRARYEAIKAEARRRCGS